MSEPKKLIEVAMPIKEISAESVRDKSIRHGHISTLHLWWARRPLPVCRAVIFASLVPDPLDENCPQQFKDAVEILLGSLKKPLNESGLPPDAFKPYDDIPYTAAIDKMTDNNRNRLMMFIGKFSNEYAINERAGKVTPTSKLISDFSLIKSENKDNELILSKAKRLIWVAHNAKNGASVKQLLADYSQKNNAIKIAEQALYCLPDRHIESEKSKVLSDNLKNAIDDFLKNMPKVFDPFAGGGAIPLEAARLGCKSFGNDINPVAHIIQKGSLEFPQKFGKPIQYSKVEFIRFYGEAEWDKLTNEKLIYKNGEAIAVSISNRLSFDVEFYAKELFSTTEKEISNFYPSNAINQKPLAYYWARVGQCSNPSCKADIPLLKQFYLSKRRSVSEDKYIYVNPKFVGNEIDFEIKNGKCELDGWNQRTNLNCPICGSITDSKSLKVQFKNGMASQRLLAVIEEDLKGNRVFRLPTGIEKEIVKQIHGVDVPQDSMQVGNNRNFNTPGWGISKFGEMFTSRQLLVLNSLIEKLNSIKKSLENKGESEYYKAIYTYLGILIDRIAARNTSLGVWHILQETVEHPFGRQAIPMVFDFPEMYPFSRSLSGGAYGQLESIIKFINSESFSSFSTDCLNASSGDKNQFSEKYLSVVITDPPYYDAIAYADLSDFFYVWLKKTVADVYPLNFATPQSPKGDECTALRHHHSNDNEVAKKHFEDKLLEIFISIEYQTSDLVSIMFAHQSTEAWTTLCNSILGARMNITGSWANDTEVTNALKNEMAVLSSSVTVACKPLIRKGFGAYRDVKSAIERTVSKEVEELYSLGFRGADLLTACFGQAVSEFGKYEKVEKADGSAVSVSDLLEMARESAFNALLKGFSGDDYTKFYIGWLQLNGFVEGDNDDAAKFTKVGLSIDVQDLYRENILLKNGNKQHLANFKERISLNIKLGEQKNCSLIDLGHKMMNLYSSPNRNNLLKFIEQNAAEPEGAIWRVLTSLTELLPKDLEDHKLAVGLLTNKDQLIREAKSSNRPKPEQSKLILE